MRWVIRYPLHSHHWGPIQIHVSSSSTKTTVTIRCRCNHSPYRLRVIVMFPRPTENILPPIFSFGGNSSLWNRQTAKSLRVQPVFILVPLHQPRVPLRFCVPRLTEVYWPTHLSLFDVAPMSDDDLGVLLFRQMKCGRMTFFEKITFSFESENSEKYSRNILFLMRLINLF